jgi:hypothetical protein
MEALLSEEGKDANRAARSHGCGEVERDSWECEEGNEGIEDKGGDKDLPHEVGLRVRPTSDTLRRPV